MSGASQNGSLPAADVTFKHFMITGSRSARPL
jgi:hypothetical protein